MKWNKDLKKAPRDGTELIFWLKGVRGHPDMTANFYYARKPRSKGLHKIFKICHPKGSGWYWVHSQDREGADNILKRPDLVKGWQVYPQPPGKK